MIILVFITTSSGFCQQTRVNTELSKEDYLQKSKRQKTAAFVFLGSGIVLSSVSLTILAAHASADVGTIVISGIAGVPPPKQHSYSTEKILLISGGIAILSSIPLFSASTKNKRKAISLSFKNEMIQQVQNKSFVKIPAPSLSVRISL